MSPAFSLPTPSPLLESPREPRSTGICPECEEEFGEHAYEIASWPDGPRIVCAYDAAKWLTTQLKAVLDAGDGDVMEILQSVDEIARCRDCDSFRCTCP